jgi:hypothetical protein
MAGKISVESTPGAGSNFTVSLQKRSAVYESEDKAKRESPKLSARSEDESFKQKL